MSNLSMSADEIRRRYRAGTSISILADLNGCGQSLISTIVGEEERPKKEKKTATARHRVDYTRARELYDAGKNDIQIADALGTTGPSIMKWRQRENLPSKVSRAEAGRRAGKASVAKRRAATENKEFAAAVQPMFEEAKKEPVESGSLPDIEQVKKELKIAAKRAKQVALTGIDAPISSDEEKPEAVNDGVIALDVTLSPEGEAHIQQLLSEVPKPSEAEHDAPGAPAPKEIFIHFGRFGQNEEGLHVIALREVARKLQELTQKPPIDLEPRDEWEARRKIAIARAISRRVGRRESLPEAWIEEWNERTAK